MIENSIIGPATVPVGFLPPAALAGMPAGVPNSVHIEEVSLDEKKFNLDESSDEGPELRKPETKRKVSIDVIGAYTGSALLAYAVAQIQQVMSGTSDQEVRANLERFRTTRKAQTDMLQEEITKAEERAAAAAKATWLEKLLNTIVTVAIGVLGVGATILSCGALAPVVLGID